VERPANDRLERWRCRWFAANGLSVGESDKGQTGLFPGWVPGTDTSPKALFSEGAVT